MTARTLIGASAQGDVETVERFARGRKAINAPNSSGFFPLSSATHHGCLAVVRYLVDHGARVNKRTRLGWTPLFIAVHRGYGRIARFLLRRGAAPNIHVRWGEFMPVPAGQTPLHEACRIGRADLVRLLIGNGAALESRNAARETPLHVAAGAGSVPAIRLLLEAGANPHTRDHFLRNTPLHHAADTGGLPSVRALLEGGADPLRRNAHRARAVDVARAEGNGGIVRVLRPLSGP